MGAETAPSSTTAEQMIARALPELRRQAREWSRMWPPEVLAAWVAPDAKVLPIAALLEIPELDEDLVRHLASLAREPAADRIPVLVLRPVWRWSLHLVDVRPHLRLV